MKARFALVLALAVSGCHSLTSEEVTEVRDNGAAGQRLLARWDKTPDSVKKDFVFAFTRTCFNVLFTTDGKPVPAEFAPVTSDSK